MLPDVRHALCICWSVLSRAEHICNHVVLACLWQGRGVKMNFIAAIVTTYEVQACWGS